MLTVTDITASFNDGCFESSLTKVSLAVMLAAAQTRHFCCLQAHVYGMHMVGKASCSFQPDVPRCDQFICFSRSTPIPATMPWRLAS